MSKVAALVVIRHAEDLEKWVDDKTDPRLANWIDTVNKDWPDYEVIGKPGQDNIPGPRVTLTLFQHGLSNTPQGEDAAGEAQATDLGLSLNSFLSSHGFGDVSGVITKNPSVKVPNAPGDKSNPTPNPFDTVYPFLKRNVHTGLLLITPGDFHQKEIIDPQLDALIADGALFPISNSRLLCWDAEGLWGRKVGDNRPFNKESILGKLSKHYLGDSHAIEHHSPKKCRTIYVFVGKRVEIYQFEDGKYSEPETIKHPEA